MSMNHPDWPALLSAILASPDDDTVRLVAADFLEENGAPDRAALIRAQVELARLETAAPAAPDDVWARRARIDELRSKERTFLGPLSTSHLFWAMEACPELVRVGTHLRVEGAERLTWRRGFVECVACPAAEWLKHGAAVRARQPVRQVDLSGCDTVPRDEWYAHPDAVRGLPLVRVCGYAEGGSGEWLRQWLPGTRVEAGPL